MGNEIGRTNNQSIKIDYIRNHCKSENETMSFLLNQILFPDIDKIYEYFSPEEVGVIFSKLPRQLLAIADLSIKILFDISQKNELNNIEEIKVRRITKILNLIIPEILNKKELFYLFFEQNYIHIEDISSPWLSECISKNKKEFLNEVQKPHLITLIESVQYLLFKQNICIGNILKKIELPKTQIDPALIWHSGLFVKNSGQDKIKQFNETRCDLLKLLIILCTSSVYLDEKEYFNIPNIALMILTNKFNIYGENLVVSLINTVLSYDWKGSGIPFLHSIFSDNFESKLCQVCSELLLILIDYIPVEIEKKARMEKEALLSLSQNAIINGKTEEISESLKTNHVVEMISLISSKQDMDALYIGTARLLENIIVTTSTVIPSTFKEINFSESLIYLFFRIIVINSKICQDILIRNDPKKILLPLIITLNKSYILYGKINLFYISIFSLLKFSELEEFGLILSSIPYNEGINFEVPSFKGSYCDLLILIIHKLLNLNNDALANAKSALFYILKNISYGIKNISIPSSISLLTLIAYYSSPSIIIKDLVSPFSLLEMLIDIISTIFTLNYNSNPNLVYCCFIQSKLFTRLSTITYQGCLKNKEEEELKYMERRDTDEGEVEKKEEKVNQNPEESKVNTSQLENDFESAKKRLNLELIIDSFNYLGIFLDKVFHSAETKDLKTLELIKKSSNIMLVNKPVKIEMIKLKFLHQTNEFLTKIIWELIIKMHPNAKIIDRNNSLFLRPK